MYLKCRRRENFNHLQGVYKGFVLIYERRRRDFFDLKNNNSKKYECFQKNKNQQIQENPRNYMFSSNKNEQNSEDLNQKIRTVNK